MGILKSIKIQCDLCEWLAKEFKDKFEAKREGWLETSHDSYYEDRCWYTKWLCPTCVGKIQKGFAKP